MTQDTALVIFALILFLLVPIVPKMVGLRIKVLRWLKWNRLADWHERNIPVLTSIIRAVMIVLAIYLLGIVVI